MVEINTAINQLQDFKLKIDLELDKFLSQKVENAKNISPHAEALAEHVKDMTLRGGKRIRAALAYYSYLAHDGIDTKSALNASMAMEISQTFLLIHDDIIDNDSLRRGKTTIHADYEKIANEKYKNKIDPRHFGTSIAILAGDLACAYSNEIIVTSNFDIQNQSKAIAELNKTYEREIYGEALDLITQITENITKKDIILIQELKTAPYTFDTPVKLGAILAGATEEQITNLEKYTIPMGTAFQIQDDIIGMFGSEEKIGKPVISDIREGKKTLLIFDTLESASPAQKEIINRNLGNKNITNEDHEDVKKIIIETGALDKSRDFAKKLVDEAIDALEKIELNSEGKDFLLGIAHYMIYREY
jgi:geranylgeranyl diphosphate synthase type I